MKLFDRFFKRKVKRKSHWDIISLFTPEEFSNEINRVLPIREIFIKENIPEYKMDNNQDWFLNKQTELRTSCDYAYIWLFYAMINKQRDIGIDKHQGLFVDGSLLLIYDPDKVYEYHPLLILETSSYEFAVCDYTYGPLFPTYTDALDYITKKYKINDLCLINQEYL